VNSAVVSSPKNENNIAAVQRVVRLHLPNEDHLPVNTLAAIGDTKKGRSLAINHAEIERRDNSEYSLKERFVLFSHHNKWNLSHHGNIQ
jgi:hypothetical protein